MADNPNKRRRKEKKNVDPEEQEAERLEAKRSAAEAARLERELFGGTEEDFEGFGKEEQEDNVGHSDAIGFEDRLGDKGDAREVSPCKIIFSFLVVKPG
jgi:hypothetical protein